MAAVGDKVPEVTLRTMTPEGPKPIGSLEALGKGKVVLFAVPGAFTPTCSDHHLPGFVVRAEEFVQKGVSRIACVAVNDAFVMDAWGKNQNVGDKVMMLADGSADFTKALGLELDLTPNGMGVRSKRYSMLVDDGVVKQLNLEKPGAFEVSNAETLLKQI